MLGLLFGQKKLLDDASVDWMFDTFQWALDNFDEEEFRSRSLLVQPTSAFFPGKVDSVSEKALGIFKHTLKYAGLEHWPFKLVDQASMASQPVPSLVIEKIERNSKNTLSKVELPPVEPSFGPLVAPDISLVIS